jgi:hypothetical protein
MELGVEPYFSFKKYNKWGFEVWSGLSPLIPTKILVPNKASQGAKRAPRLKIIWVMELLLLGRLSLPSLGVGHGGASWRLIVWNSI